MNGMAFIFLMYAVSIFGALGLYIVKKSEGRHDQSFEVAKLRSLASQRLPVHEDYTRLKKQMDEFEARLNGMALRVGIR